MEIKNCQFEIPVNFEGNLPTTTDEFWNWKNQNCTTTELGEILITDGTSTAYLSKKINLADIFYILFLIIFLNTLILKSIWGFVYAKKVKEKSSLDL